jgi:hypothetical protein
LGIFAEISNMAGADRLSLLPDSLIHHVLSFLSIKEVISSTSTLSKRWDRLWMSSPALTFNWKDFRDDSKFIEFVDFVFAQRQQLNLDRFELDWFNRTSTFEAVGRWLTQVVKAKPRVLVLKICCRDDHYLELPDDVFECESIVELKLSTDLSHGSCPLKPKHVNLKCLKKLKIEGNINLDDDFMKKLMCGSPPLEELQLHCRYKGLSTISPMFMNINCIKKLQLRGVINLSNDLLKQMICGCPELEELELECNCEGELNISSRSVNLGHLKKLHIRGGINLDNKLMKKLMRGSPILEELLLECHYDGLSRISSKSIKNLKMYCNETEKFEISIPSLLSLSIEGAVAGKISCKNLQSLLEAHICVEACRYDDGATLLGAFLNAEKLHFDLISTMVNFSPYIIFIIC